MRNKPYIRNASRDQVSEKAQRNDNGQLLDKQTGKAINNNHYLHRAYIRKSTREEVLARAEKNEKGQLLDANTHQPIEGKYDIGHKPGHEFRTARADAESRNLTQAEFNDLQNNPDHLQIEDPHENRSHKYEAQNMNETPQEAPSQTDGLSQQGADSNTEGQSDGGQSQQTGSQDSSGTPSQDSSQGEGEGQSM